MKKSPFEGFETIKEHGLIFDPSDGLFHVIIEYKANGKIEITGVTIDPVELAKQEERL